ncbi:MAG: hypothetical protein ABI577_00235 [bacterium]
MRDLSFQEALDDPELPFQQFVQGCLDLWNRAVEIYEAAGSPNGPAEDGDNLASWVLAKLNALAAIGEAEELLGLDECEE